MDMNYPKPDSTELKVLHLELKALRLELKALRLPPKEWRRRALVAEAQVADLEHTIKALTTALRALEASQSRPTRATTIQNPPAVTP